MKHYPADPNAAKVFLGLGSGAVIGVIAGQYLGNTMILISAGMTLGGLIGSLCYYFDDRKH
ncbi:MAG: hypothetical protein IJD13_00445 [Oscillospiraceae bacterium]|nr:hypothetical protein [Oscillospiraceae bacterium]